MTEEEWFASRDVQLMIQHLDPQQYDRKLRLFAVACCRRIWDLIPNPIAQRLVELVELFADGEVSFGEVKELHRQVEWSPSANCAVKNSAALDCASWRASAECYARAARQAIEAVVSRTATSYSDSYANWLRADHTKREAIAQIFFLRDICGNPFRPPDFSSDWRTSTAVLLARQMYESREFSAMPILADALQDAGCDNENILNHCRGESLHVRGCWVVDLVLGKA